MSKSCVIIPRKNNIVTGEKEDSKLFKDLLSFTSTRQQAVNIYLKIQNPEFLKEINKKLVFDSLNEPNFWELFKVSNLKEYIGEPILVDKIAQKYGFNKKGNPIQIPYNKENYDRLVEQVINYNKNAPSNVVYLAEIGSKDNDRTMPYLYVNLVPRNSKSLEEANKLEQNNLLNSKLKNILFKNGISVGALTELDRRMAINGVTDFSRAKVITDGLIELIRLADGVEGEKALPEEFSHFLIEANLDNPLIQRLIGHLKDNKELLKYYLKDSYDTYVELYEGDSYKMAKEVAGKIVADALFKQNLNNVPTTAKSLIKRVIDYIKGYLKSLKGMASDLNNAKNEIDQIGNILAKQALDGSLPLDINNVHTSESFYNTKERIARDKALLQTIIDNEIKRLHIYNKRSVNSTFTESQQELITKLQESLIDNTEIEGIYTFLEKAANQLESLSKRLLTLQKDSTLNYNEKAMVLRDIRNYIYSYSNIIDSIRDILNEERNFEDNRYGQKIKVLADQMLVHIADLTSDYRKNAFPLFADFLKLYVGDSVRVPSSKAKGETITVEELLKLANSDIGFFDRWLDSMSDSSDSLLRIFDSVVKESKEKSRLKTIQLSKEIKKLGLILEKEGFKNQDWMFERDAEGNLTGNYIGEINTALYEKAKKEMLKSLKAKYKDNLTKENLKEYRKERQQWFEENTEKVGEIRRPKFSIYENKEFTNLSLAQKAFYNSIIEMKQTLDAALPDNVTTTLNAVKIRKDLIERLKGSSSPKEAVMEFVESVKDSFIRRSDDVEFSDRNIIKDFEGRAIQVLPIYYTKWDKDQDLNNLSTDVVSTMIAYANMAIEYEEMNKVVHILEIGRDIVRERSIIQTQSGKQLKEKFKEIGHTVESVLTKKGSESRIIERLNDFFEMQIYGRYIKDEGTFMKTKIDKAKTADNLNLLTAVNQLALNLLNGISNVATGSVMMHVEAIAGEFFQHSNVFTADKNYTKELPSFIKEIGMRSKTNKLSLWEERFNVLQDHEVNLRKEDFDRKSRFSRLASISSLFFINKAGEHWMQMRTSLALADTIILKDKNGNKLTLWDAMEVVYLDKNNPSLGATLELKEGVTKENGEPVTDKDLFAFSRKSAKINQKMHGIYNNADKAALQKLAIGRLAFMFRKWIKPALNKRFKSASYDYDLDSETEGYYLTTYNFFNVLIKDLRQSQFDLVSRWDKLSNTEKSNLKRAMAEVGHLLALALVLGLVNWDDKEDRVWLSKLTEYQLRRLYTEIGALTPGTTMLTEGLRIIKSPAAGVNTLENFVNVTKLLNPYNYIEEVESGRFKDHTKAYRALFESPLIPMNKTVYKVLNPEEGIPFFKQ